LEQTRFKLK